MDDDNMAAYNTVRLSATANLHHLNNYYKPIIAISNKNSAALGSPLKPIF